MVIYNEKITKPIMSEIFSYPVNTRYQICQIIVHMLTIFKTGDWHIETMQHILDIWKNNSENIPLLYDGFNSFIKIMVSLPPQDPRIR
jgi:hypothetical protein